MSSYALSEPRQQYYTEALRSSRLFNECIKHRCLCLEAEPEKALAISAILREHSLRSIGSIHTVLRFLDLLAVCLALDGKHGQLGCHYGSSVAAGKTIHRWRAGEKAGPRTGGNQVPKTGHRNKIGDFGTLELARKMEGERVELGEWSGVS